MNEGLKKIILLVFTYWRNFNIFNFLKILLIFLYRKNYDAILYEYDKFIV